MARVVRLSLENIYSNLIFPETMAATILKDILGNYNARILLLLNIAPSGETTIQYKDESLSVDPIRLTEELYRENISIDEYINRIVKALERVAGEDDIIVVLFDGYEYAIALVTPP